MTPQRIPPELLAITPPTQRDVGARRVGPELVAVRGEDAVDVAEHRPGLDPRAGAAVLDRDAAEVAADVDQDAVGLPLAVEAGAAARGRRPGCAVRRP